MSPTRSCVLSPEQLADYDEKGFVDSIPVLSPEEVRHYWGLVERTWAALGGHVTRADGLHLYFRWAWELASHPQLLDCMESLLGPDIILKHTRIFYKYSRSAAWVGWHQDGYTERLTEGRAPAIWLGLTEATVENGCLRVVPGSHRLGILAHCARANDRDLASSSFREPVLSSDNGGERSPGLAEATEAIDPPYDVVMRAGEMSFHHPLLLHGSNPNLSGEPRIGLSATYSTPALHGSGAAVALVRGSIGPHRSIPLSEKPDDREYEDAASAFLASGRQILYGSD
jgi:non-heme Fe2+,alpha-ketoglutarate-dependent halogenase